MISGKARLAGVIGWPVSHSLSPKLHQYWIDHHGIDGAYVPLAVKPEDVAAAMAALPKLGFHGANLTIPHKQSVLPLLDSLDDAAQHIGAVNTLVIDGDGRIFGMNTDAYGFIENICPHLAAKKKAVMLGAGGAALAVAYALKQAGFAEIVVTNRTQEKSEALSERFSLTALPWERRAAALDGADLLVNTTSLGLEGQPPLALDLAALPAHALVTDIVYKPLLTPLLVQAKARGNPIVDGLGMLMHQAVPGFEAWFGVRPEVTAALREFLLA